MSQSVGSVCAADPIDREQEELEELVSSIDRSRKRNLSHGLLRGDQVADRLLDQESSASPCFKKQKPVAGMALTKADLHACIDRQTAKLSTRLDSVDESISTLRSDLTIVNRNVKTNAEKIEAQGQAIKSNLDKISGLEGDIKRLRDNPLPRVPPPSYPEVQRAEPINDDAYFKARRSLRIWPVEGEVRETLWLNSGNFIAGNLGLNIGESLIEDVYRPEVPSGPGAKREVVIVFKQTQSRDSVMGASAKLAPFIDGAGRPTAGIRLEIPASLRQQFGLLFRYGQALRARHGAGFRRHIKFDDLDKALFLNVKLPGDEAWSKVTADVARRGLRSRETIRSNELERRLDVNGPLSLDRPRAASSSLPMQLGSPTRPTPWTGRRSSAAE